MAKKTDNTLWYVVGVVVLVLLIWYFVAKTGAPEAETPAAEVPDETPASEAPVETPVEDGAETPVISEGKVAPSEEEKEILGKIADEELEAEDNIVKIGDKVFVPAELTVKKDTVVMFKNTRNTRAMVQAKFVYSSGEHEERRSFKTNQLNPGESEGLKLDLAGTWEFIDVTRPSIQGTITVEE